MAREDDYGQVYPEYYGDITSFSITFTDEKETVLKKLEKHLSKYSINGWNHLSSIAYEDRTNIINKETGKFLSVKKMTVKATLTSTLDDDVINEHVAYREELIEAEDTVKTLKPVTMKPWIAILIASLLGFSVLFMMSIMPFISKMIQAMYQSGGQVVSLGESARIGFLWFLGIEVIGLIIFLVLLMKKKKKIKEIKAMYDEEVNVLEEYKAWKERLEELQNTRTTYLDNYVHTVVVSRKVVYYCSDEIEMDVTK